MNQSNHKPTTIPLNLEQAEASFHQAQKLVEAGNNTGAIAEFTQAIEANPQQARYYLALGIAQVKTQQWQAALDSLQTAVKLNPDLHLAHHRLGDIYAHLNQHQQAIECFQQAVSIAPEFMPAYHRLGDVLHHENQIEAAAAAYRQAVNLQGDHFPSQLGLGLTLFKLGQTQAAEQALQQALALKPDSAIAYYRLAEILLRRRNTSAAIEHLQQAIKCNPDLASAYHRLADVRQSQGRLAEAVELYHRAIGLNPNNQWSYFNLASALNKQDKLSEAESNYAQAIEVNSDFAEAYCNLGYVQTRRGNIQAAIANFQQSSQKYIQTQCPNLKIASEAQTRTKPDFFIIGSMKSGTTSMYEYITHHPQFLPVIQKEIDFFSIRYHHGLPWYQAHFAPQPQGEGWFTGEASTSYIDYPQVPQRIHQDYPTAKIIAVLRNPIDRAFSHYNHVQKYHPGKESRSFAAAVEAEMNWLNQFENPYLEAALAPNSETFAYLKYGYLFRGLYIYFLQEWMSLFPESQFLILKSENFYQQPAKTMSEIYQFLDVPTHHLEQYPVYNVGSYNQKIDSKLYQKLKVFFQPHNHKLESVLQQLDW